MSFPEFTKTLTPLSLHILPVAFINPGEHTALGQGHVLPQCGVQPLYWLLDSDPPFLLT